MKTVAVTGNDIGILFELVNHLASTGQITEETFKTPEAKAVFHSAQSIKDEKQYRIFYVPGS